MAVVTVTTMFIIVADGFRECSLSTISGVDGFHVFLMNLRRMHSRTVQVRVIK